MTSWYKPGRFYCLKCDIVYSDSPANVKGQCSECGNMLVNPKEVFDMTYPSQWMLGTAIENVERLLVQMRSWQTPPPIIMDRSVRYSMEKERLHGCIGLCSWLNAWCGRLRLE